MEETLVVDDMRSSRPSDGCNQKRPVVFSENQVGNLR